MPFTINKMRMIVCGLVLSLFVSALCGGLASLLPLTTEVHAQVPTRRALLVGISDYENGTNPMDGWRNLNTSPDLDNMRHVLETYYDFKGSGLHTIQNEKATQEDIIREFRRHLISSAKPGDAVVFYYTGHGFQVPDVSGDETADREDEVTVTWVPKDKQRLPDKERRAMMYLLDDTYELLLRELSQKMRGEDGKVRGSITVIFDSCNSGSAAKGVLVPKGRMWDEKIDGPRPAAPLVSDVASGWLSHAKGQFESTTFIAGSQSNQYSYMMPDSDKKGSILTYHVAEFLANVAREKPDRPVTYKDMHDKISAKVLGFGKAQDPQVEGNINSEIFGNGQPIIPQLLPSVRSVLTGPMRLELNIGSLHGITRGTLFNIYKSGSDVKNPANKIAVLEIDDVRSITSVGKVTNTGTPAPPPSVFQAAQAVVAEYRLDGQPLKVLIQKGISPGESGKEKALSDALAAQAFITSVGVTHENFDVKLGWCKDDKDSWCKSNKDTFFYQRAGEKIVSLGLKPDPASLQKRLLAAWRWRHLANLTLPRAPKVRIDMLGKDGSPIRRDAGGKIVLKRGDIGQVFITNNTGAPMFITLIYLKDSGEIEVLPGAGTVNGQQPLSADNKPVHVFDLSDIEAPNGNEVEILKIIATPRPADFSGMSFTEEERKGIKSKGPLNPMEELLFGLVDANAKGGRIRATDVDQWYTDQLTYEIRAN